MEGVGAYGKMPSLGDFFRIGLPRSFCDPWDQWLQKALVSSRAALGARWEECYMSAPIWRFSIAKGIVGSAAMNGVVMPSVDRVGRAFPLTLAGAQPSAFAELEEIALSALEDDMTKERLHAALAKVEAQPDTDATPKGARWEALLESRTLSFATDTLPEGAEALRLFDLATWSTPVEPLSDARV